MFTWGLIWAAFLGSTMRTCSKCLSVCCRSFCSARTYFFSRLKTWWGWEEEERRHIKPYPSQKLLFHISNKKRIYTLIIPGQKTYNVLWVLWKDNLVQPARIEEQTNQKTSMGIIHAAGWKQKGTSAKGNEIFWSWSLLHSNEKRNWTTTVHPPPSPKKIQTINVLLILEGVILDDLFNFQPFVSIPEQKNASELFVPGFHDLFWYKHLTCQD